MNGFVLAGGESRRMGRDKALLEWDGRPLIEHMVELLRGVGLEPRICGGKTGGDLARYAPVVADRWAGCGPLGGIEAGLAVSDAELSLFIAVDVPLVPAALLRWMMERAGRSRPGASGAGAGGDVALIPMVEGRAQPLCAVYSRRLLAGVRGALERGMFKVMTAIEEAAAGERIEQFAVEAVAGALPAGAAAIPVQDWFRNVNAPADYEWLRERGATGAGKRHPIS